jgi:hypothetical protein
MMLTINFHELKKIKKIHNQPLKRKYPGFTTYFVVRLVIIRDLIIHLHMYMWKTCNVHALHVGTTCLKTEDT